MSDSDVDLLPNNNVFTFQNESTTVSAMGPNINASNLTGLSFRNNIMTSTMNMPRNFERQEQSFDQGRYYRRDTSPPMSLHSASSFRPPRNYQHMNYPRGTSSQKSMINGRSGSPTMSIVSMRSIDSNATVNVAMALKNMNFNDLSVIKDACNHFMKKRMQKKMKSRNPRRFMKRYRSRRSGYDSGELGSDSSISSDDGRSTCTAYTSVYRDKMSSSRSTKTDFFDFRRTMKESNLYKDCTERFRQNTFNNMLGVAPRDATAHSQSRVQNEPPVTQKDRFKSSFLLPSQRFNQSVASVPIPEKQDRSHNLVPNNRDFESHTIAPRNSSELEPHTENTFNNMLGVAPRNATAHSQSSVQKKPLVTQKDRFASSFLLPSQRFNQSVASVQIPEKQDRSHNLVPNNRDFESHTNAPRNSSELESEQEEIFSEITIREKSICNANIQSKTKADPRKRCLEVDAAQPNKKRSKLSSPPKKNVTEVPLQKEFNKVKDKNSNDFQFLKPQFPIRKSGNIKVKEKLLAKSAEPLVDTVICADNVPKSQAPHPHCDQNNVKETEPSEQQSDLASTSDVSMRPSFIKRKLYTQKFDVLESKNTSNDNFASPQNVYSAIQKEKHKARKLVTNQSCLSRDVREDNNLLDLIHKIVPPDRMNVTNMTNKSEIANISTKNKQDDDKWDITSAVITDDVSDTYTDEEIFINESSRKQVNNKENIKKAGTNGKTLVNENAVASKAKSPNVKKKESPSKKKSPIKKKKESSNKNKSPSEKKSPSDCYVLVEPVNQAPEKLHKKTPVSAKPDNKKPLPEKKKQSAADETRDVNKGKIYKSFWDTDFESDVEGVPSAKKVKEKENNINQGNLTLKERINLDHSNKSLDTTQSKFVWNSNSKTAVTLKSHSFSSQVKAVNVNKIFTKGVTENAKEKKNAELPQSQENQTKSTKAPSTKIVLDTYNSTVSDNTQNETVLNTNHKSRAPRAKKGENMKKNEDTTKKKDMSTTQVPGQTKSKTSPVKAKSATVNNAKPQRRVVDKIIASKRSPASPKEFTCCKEPVNKKSKTETLSKAKTNKKTLDNYNSTLSDNTLDEIIKKGSRSRALRATRIKNIENSILDDSQMFNMTLRSRQLNTSIVKGLNNKKTTVPARAEEKARNTSKSSQTKDTQSKPNKTLWTPVKGPKSISKSKTQSPRTNNKVNSTPVHKRAIKCK